MCPDTRAGFSFLTMNNLLDQLKPYGFILVDRKYIIRLLGNGDAEMFFNELKYKTVKTDCMEFAVISFYGTEIKDFYWFENWYYYTTGKKLE